MFGLYQHAVEEEGPVKGPKTAPEIEG